MPQDIEAYILRTANALLTKHGVLPDVFLAQSLKWFIRVSTFQASNNTVNFWPAKGQVDEIGF